MVAAHVEKPIPFEPQRLMHLKVKTDSFHTFFFFVLSIVCGAAGRFYD
jgi:hypothetical protein